MSSREAQLIYAIGIGAAMIYFSPASGPFAASAVSGGIGLVCGATGAYFSGRKDVFLQGAKTGVLLGATAGVASAGAIYAGGFATGSTASSLLSIGGSFAGAKLGSEIARGVGANPFNKEVTDVAVGVGFVMGAGSAGTTQGSGQGSQGSSQGGSHVPQWKW